VNTRILITGSSGLIGRALCSALGAAGRDIVEFDLRATTANQAKDVRVAADVTSAIEGCVGVVHLAAISRVVWGERDPAACSATNIDGTTNVLRAATRAEARPWFLFASSREVYGEPAALPVTEDAPLTPINIYGRTKIRGEALTSDARASGLRTAIVRLSNVYGCIHDHANRVVPAFAKQAATGAPLRVDGSAHTFDFTHIDDTVMGIQRVIDALERGRDDLPPIHLLTGTPTTLGELAHAAVELAGSASVIRQAPPRDYDVARFYGDPERAHQLLDWRAATTLRAGLARLIADFRRELATKAGAL
jgi:nucleoside-diphosphate-sugar epimerase